MKSLIPTFTALVATRPRAALTTLAVVTIALASGNMLAADQADSSVFLPPDAEVAIAAEQLDTTFPDSAGLENVTVIHRGDIFTVAGLAHIDDVVTELVSDPRVAERLAITDPVTSVSGFVAAVAGTDVSTMAQEDVDATLALIEHDPELHAILNDLTGVADGEELAISSIRLRELGDPDGLDATELVMADIAEDVDGPLAVRTLSGATIDEESNDASSSSMAVLMVLALGVIALLLFVFFRTGWDTLLGMAGLGITIAGTLGAQGLLGPNGIGLIGQPNQITSMIPIMLIGLVVDYAIQGVAHYRELRLEGDDVADAARRGLAGVMLPLGLAAITTVISFLTNLISPIPANQDFGIVAAVGVSFGLLVMLVLVPAARAIVDGRRARAGTLRPPRAMSDAIPGAGRAVAAIGDVVARRPALLLAAAAVVTVGFGVAATSISTEFDSNDFLPGGGDSLTDIEALDQALGGRTEIATILVEADLTDDRTLRNLLGLSDAFADELSRPTGAAGDITSSLGLLFADWSTDDGPGDEHYDPELSIMAADLDQGLTVDADGVQGVLDRLRANDRVGFDQVADQSNGTDRTLLQFHALTGDQERTQQMVDDIEGLWFGDRDQIIATSGEITNLEITNSMTSSQTESIAATILAALVILMIFFGVTEFRPMLAVFAVLPIVLVLVWILGTMTLLGIPYNVVTALITALSIGIGVDYTIHIIHRFTEELEHDDDLADATRATLSTTGAALIGSALTTALGFSVLLFSPLTPFQQFGLVTAVTIVYALVASIVVVPPLLLAWAAYHQWRRQTQRSGAPGATRGATVGTTT